MGERWPPLEVPDSELVRDPCGWTMSGVEEERRPSGTVPEAPGAGATVTTQRMQGWSVLVCVCVVAGCDGGGNYFLFRSQLPPSPRKQ